MMSHNEESQGLLNSERQEGAHDQSPQTLQQAILQNNFSAMQALLDGGASPDGSRRGFMFWVNGTSNEVPPIVLAARFGRYDMVVELCRRGADVNRKQGVDEHTALSVAAQKGHAAIVALLIEQGAELNTKIYRSDATALTLAGHAGHVDVAIALLNAGAHLWWYAPIAQRYMSRFDQCKGTKDMAKLSEWAVAEMNKVNQQHTEEEPDILHCPTPVPESLYPAREVEEDAVTAEVDEIRFTG